MSFQLPDLPYDKDALEPHISKRTLDYHYGKHHAGYVKKLNGIVEGTPKEKATLEELVAEASGDPEQKNLFNNAAQVWNHTLYWESMAPNAAAKPDGALASAIDDCFGDLDAFKDEFKKAGSDEFGSGWVWLVANNGKLEITHTTDAVIPVDTFRKVLLTMDVWEHAYYLDQQNDRGAYMDAFVNKLLNWKNAEKRLAAV